MYCHGYLKFSKVINITITVLKAENMETFLVEEDTD